MSIKNKKMYRVFGTNSLLNKELTSECKITLYSQKLKKSHRIRVLKNYTKVIIKITRSDWTCETFITEYYSKTNSVIIRDYKFKLLEDRVKDTTSLTLKMFREEQVAEYYKDYLLQDIVTVTSL
jgi:hypothetical protein